MNNNSNMRTPEEQREWLDIHYVAESNSDFIWAAYVLHEFGVTAENLYKMEHDHVQALLDTGHDWNDIHNVYDHKDRARTRFLADNLRYWELVAKTGNPVVAPAQEVPVQDENTDAW